MKVNFFFSVHGNGTFRDSLPHGNCNLVEINRLYSKSDSYILQMDCKELVFNRTNVVVSLNDMHCHSDDKRFIVTYDNITI